ncbi:unnamed protein product, partial [Phaeothamnion confervicola]
RWKRGASGRSQWPRRPRPPRRSRTPPQQPPPSRPPPPPWRRRRPPRTGWTRAAPAPPPPPPAAARGRRHRASWSSWRPSWTTSWSTSTRGGCGGPAAGASASAAAAAAVVAAVAAAAASAAATAVNGAGRPPAGRRWTVCPLTHSTPTAAAAGAALAAPTSRACRRRAASGASPAWTSRATSPATGMPFSAVPSRALLNFSVSEESLVALVSIVVLLPATLCWTRRRFRREYGNGDNRHDGAVCSICCTPLCRRSSHNAAVFVLPKGHYGPSLRERSVCHISPSLFLLGCDE